jgi:tetratricopeptide (TPR) repeat protein
MKGIPMHAEEHVSLGTTKVENQDYLGAIACFDAALQLDPTNGTALFGKGFISYNLRDDKAAEDALSAAIRLCPDTGIFSKLIEVAAAYALRCTSRLNLNDRKGAWEDYKKVFSLDKQLAREIRFEAQTCVGTSQFFVYFTMYPGQATMIIRYLILAE